MTTQETVFITGASSGIGEACAHAFAASGARLILVARREERLRSLQQELGVESHVLVLDVTRRADVERQLAALPTAFSNVTVLINSAGLALGIEPAPRASVTDWEQMISTNINGVVNCTHALLTGMVARDRGHIINVGSVAAMHPYPGGNAYGATKAFIHQFSLNLRADLLGSKVRVTNIEPGMVETEFSVVRFNGDQEKARNVYAGMQPLTPQDIAETIHWCAHRPAHVNINCVELMPVAQAFGPFAVKRQ